MENRKPGFWTQNPGFTENLGFLLENLGFVWNLGLGATTQVLSKTWVLKETQVLEQKPRFWTQPGFCSENLGFVLEFVFEFQIFLNKIKIRTSFQTLKLKPGFWSVNLGFDT